MPGWVSGVYDMRPGPAVVCHIAVLAVVTAVAWAVAARRFEQYTNH